MEEAVGEGRGRGTERERERERERGREREREERERESERGRCSTTHIPRYTLLPPHLLHSHCPRDHIQRCGPCQRWAGLRGQAGHCW